ncbi:hypothetical protein L598_001500000750 [Mesorhizobium sp. J18]|nr:hypothetical protein L598_001500000750 [Mesorhizobium sp. J18]
MLLTLFLCPLLLLTPTLLFPALLLPPLTLLAGTLLLFLALLLLPQATLYPLRSGATTALLCHDYRGRAGLLTCEHER